MKEIFKRKTVSNYCLEVFDYSLTSAGGGQRSLVHEADLYHVQVAASKTAEPRL